MKQWIAICVLLCSYCHNTNKWRQQLTMATVHICLEWNIDTKCNARCCLTHWGRVTHVWVGNITIIGSDNGLSPGRRQAIIWTNVGILLIGTLGTNFSEMLIEILTFLFKKIHLKMSSGKWRPFCLGLKVLLLVSCKLSSTISPWSRSAMEAVIQCHLY